MENKTIEHKDIKNNLLMVSLDNFYKKGNNHEKLLQIIDGNTVISLRIIDWFVTNYSKKHNINYPISYIKTRKRSYNNNDNDNKNNNTNNDNNNEDSVINVKKVKNFIVFARYKAELKGYSKKQFDPFCRKTRIKNWGPENKLTTIAQLNFFRWAIKNKIIDYIENHIDEIEKDMNEGTRTKKQINFKNKKTVKGKNISKPKIKILPKKTEKISKRKQLSQNASKMICKMNNVTVIDFD